LEFMYVRRIEPHLWGPEESDMKSLSWSAVATVLLLCMALTASSVAPVQKGVAPVEKQDGAADKGLKQLEQRVNELERKLKSLQDVQEVQVRTVSKLTLAVNQSQDDLREMKYRQQEDARTLGEHQRAIAVLRETVRK
jgi:TolA-binding protein